METVKSFLFYHAAEGGDLCEETARELIVECVAECEEEGFVFISDCPDLETAKSLPFHALAIQANAMAREWELERTMRELP